jgi:hypothetical protein
VSKDLTFNIYKLRPCEGCEWLLAVDNRDYDLLTFNGIPRATSWKPIRMRRLKFTERGQFRRPCDFPAGSGGDNVFMSHAAREKLGPYLDKYGEFLPLSCDEGNFWTFHVTHFVDALDENASDVLRASDDPGRILMIHKHVFRPEKLTADWMFKLPQSGGRGAFYVTDPFINLIHGFWLTGVKFHRVWPIPERGPRLAPV